MAELTPEMAFLQSMQNEQIDSNPVLAEADSESDASIHDDSSSASEDADAPEEEENEEEEEDEDYDPSALITPSTVQASEKPNGTAQAAPVSKPRAKGGFIVDDSDEEEGGVAASASVGTNGLSGGAGLTEAQRSLTGTPLNGVASNDVQISQSVDTPLQDNNPTLNAPISSVLGATSSTPTPSVPVTTNTSEQTRPRASALPKVRLPTDTVGILEDRIAEDERGDIDAWLELINEHRSKNRLDDARKIYERYFQVFPTAADQWADYARMELDHDEFYRVENIFSRSLLNIPNVKLWSMYLDYIRRRNNLINDPDGRARQTVSQAYEFVLNNIGIDKDAGPIWKDYLAFLKSGPGTPGGANWQDQQKMDSLRKAYRQAIVVPTQEVEGIWREYYTFETQLNVTTGRKFLQEITPSMLAAKQALVPIQNITKNVVRSTTPKLPPLPGFDGDVEHDEQVDIWKRWIQWEKEDHLELRDDDLATYYKRILFLYKQATITMRFEPYFWYDAAEFCFANHTEENKLNEEGAKFLENGIQANPESALLAYKLADRTETTTVKEEGDDAIKRRGEQVRAPYSKLLDALYGLMKVNDVREEKTISRIQENFAQQIAQSPVSDVDEEEQQAKQKILQDIQDAQIRGVQAGSKTQNELLKKMVTFTWIALMRAMRRVQGKGKIGDPVGGMRSVFNEARKRGHLTSDVYVASALLEHHCYKDPAATKIFERGVRLYPLDENFALEYLKHLIDINDLTNARAVFETAVNRFTLKPETTRQAIPLYMFFHHFESTYGELSQISKLEARIRVLFPNEFLDLFAHRYQMTTPSTLSFDPTSARPIISMKSQARPKAMPSIETQHLSPKEVVDDSPAPFSPRPTNAHLTVQDTAPRLSPKRPYQPDSNIVEDSGPPRKLPRGESPFKGAAGRRINAAKANNTATPPLPRDINIFLSILPRAEIAHTLPHLIPVTSLMTILRHVNLTQLQHQVQHQQSHGMQRGGSAQGHQGQQHHAQQHYGYPQR